MFLLRLFNTWVDIFRCCFLEFGRKSTTYLNWLWRQYAFMMISYFGELQNSIGFGFFFSQTKPNEIFDLHVWHIMIIHFVYKTIVLYLWPVACTMEIFSLFTMMLKLTRAEKCACVLYVRISHVIILKSFLHVPHHNRSYSIIYFHHRFNYI